jgi:SulP family sulfate permease
MATLNRAWLQKTMRRIRRYFRAKFRADLTAGLTITMVVIPQSMAYAAILGINPIFGLFTAIIPTITAALFSKFPYLVIGPTNPTALVTASVLMAYANRGDFVEFVFAVAIIAGILNIIFGFIKLGKITRYISNSVLVGFLTGVGVLVITYQLGNLFGIELLRDSNIWEVFIQLVRHVPNINFFTLAISILSFTILVFVRTINRKIPAALIAILITSLLVYFTGWHENSGVELVSAMGLSDRIPLAFHIPKISDQDFFSLIISGAAVALFSLMESLSIAKAMSQMTGETLDPSQQILSQGIASFVGGFFNCMPSSASPSRTVMNVVNGAKTRLSAIFSGLGVLVFLLAFSNLIAYIPQAALAAVVIFSAAGLININLIKVTWQSRTPSKVVVVLTFISTLVLPLEYAIYLGILSTILIYLGESSRVNLSYIVETGDGQYAETSIDEIKKQPPRIAIINIEGDLYFAAAEGLQEQISKILETDVEVLILRFRRTHLLASTGIMAIDQLLREARIKGVEILFCGILEETYEPLKTAGMVELIGESKIFTAQDTLFDSTQRALKKARTILEEKNAT